MLLSDLCRGDRAWAAAGTLLPDVIDKTLDWVLGLTPCGRYLAHSLAGAALLTAGAVTVGGRRRGLSFGVSYLAHLTCDLWEGGRVPWLMPFRRYRHTPRPEGLAISPAGLLLEASATLLLVILARWGRADAGETQP